MDFPSLPDNFRVVVPIVAGVGNALMSSPMVRQLKRHPGKPRILISAMIDAMAEPFRRMPEVDEVFVTGRGRKGVLRGISWTRQNRPDVYLVPFPSNRWQYNLLAAASGAKHVVMHSYPVGGLRTLSSLAGATRLPAERGLHDVIQNLRLLPELGITPDETDRPRFLLEDADHDVAAELLGQLGAFIAVHAGSARTLLAKAKRWPPVRYAELINTLRNETSREVVLLEGPDEAGVADEITMHLPPRATARVLKLSGSLGIAAAVLGRAALYVGSDSGLAHLAAAVDTPAVTLFAPADPDRVCPYGYRHLVVQPPRECSPCFLYPWEATKPKMRCREPMCISLIEVEQVMQAVRKGLAP